MGALCLRNVEAFSEERRMPRWALDCMAERVGFEPTIQFPVYGTSNAAPSAARPPLLPACWNRHFDQICRISNTASRRGPLRSKVAAIQYLQYVSPTTDVDKNLFSRRP